MALPRALWLPPTALGNVDDEHYRALVIEKAHLPAPENQSGSKRLIVETMASVGINTDVTDIVYAPAPGDTRPGFVTVRFVAQVTEGAQPNSKKVWASHPLGRFEALKLLLSPRLASLPSTGLRTLKWRDFRSEVPAIILVRSYEALAW